MHSSVFTRGASALALAFACCSLAQAQQSLPTIDIGGQRRAPTRGTAAPARQPATGGPSAPAAPTPLVSSRFPSEPKTPVEAYIVREASTGTKMNIPLRQIPATVNVVPRQVIQDQQVTLAQDALENVSGVHSNNNDIEGYNFTIRGFQSLFLYRNNLAVPAGFSNPTQVDTATIERIEVLKGPASVLYGRAEPGGVINIITKQPLDRPLYRVEQQFGSFSHYRTQWDFSTPIVSIPGLAARVSGAYQNNGSFRAFQGGERIVVAPVVSYRPSDWTEFTVEGQFLEQRAQSDMGVPTFGPRPVPVPLSRSFQEPNDPRDRIANINIGYTFKQKIAEDWAITNRFLYTNTPVFDKPNISSFCAFPWCLDPADNLRLPRIGQYQSLAGDTLSTNIDLTGKFRALEGEHNVLMGLDYYNTLYNYYFGDSGSAPSIDVFQPIYGTVSPDVYLAAKAGVGFKGHSNELHRGKGFYLQDHITWFERLHALLGVRYDVADVTRGVSNSGGGDFSATKNLAIENRLQATTRVDTAWSPRLGLVYDILPLVSAYGSYSQSFGANNGFFNNVNLGPQRAHQWEVGLKAEPLPGLNASLAFFQITKTGVAIPVDFLNSTLAGVQRSRGIDLDIIGSLTERATLVANYEYLDAKVISDLPKDPLDPFSSGLLGNHLQNAPRHSGKVFLTYDFGESGLGLRVGGGVTASSHFWGDYQNTFVLPSWARLDAFASYSTLFEGHKMTAQLNLKNITNTQYFTGVDNFYNFYNPPLSSLPAPPFTAVGTLRFEW